jgi:hypothetical protein
VIVEFEKERCRDAPPGRLYLAAYPYRPGTTLERRSVDLVAAGACSPERITFVVPEFLSCNASPHPLGAVKSAKIKTPSAKSVNSQISRNRSSSRSSDESWGVGSSAINPPRSKVLKKEIALTVKRGMLM